jgi:hypothetical protein
MICKLELSDMSIFNSKNNGSYFNHAKWEHQASLLKSSPNNVQSLLENTEFRSTNDNQFILFQLADGDQGIINTNEITPTRPGSSDKPDINMLLDFYSFKIGSNEDIDKDTKATLQLQIGQEEKLGPLEKLFYCINGGLYLFNEITGKKTDAKDFKKSTNQALGNKPISMPAGVEQISLKVVKHEEPRWWQKYFRLLNLIRQKNYSLLSVFRELRKLRLIV